MSQSHTCDLTAIELVISETGGARRAWNLAHDLSPDLHAGNPHPDSHGNPGTWHFYRGEMAHLEKGGEPIVSVPEGSLLAAWLDETDQEKREKLAHRVQALATAARKEGQTPDARLQRQLRHLRLLDCPS